MTEIAAAGPNLDIYDKRLTADPPWPRFDWIPRCIYFYYIAFDEDRLRVDHYFYRNGPLDNPGEWNEIMPAEVAAILPELVANARSPDPKDPPACGHNFQDVVWTRTSHMVFLIDAAAWAFRKRSEGLGAIAFSPAKGSTPNHTFFDGRDIDVQLPGSEGSEDNRTAVAFINHMKRNSEGDDLGHETQHFRFEIYFDVSYGDLDAPTVVVILDPDGQNQGPRT